MKSFIQGSKTKLLYNDKRIMAPSIGWVALFDQEGTRRRLLGCCKCVLYLYVGGVYRNIYIYIIYICKCSSNYMLNICILNIATQFENREEGLPGVWIREIGKE